MAVDSSGVFSSQVPFADYQRAQQDFEMRKAAAAQQLQGGGIDIATKTGLYKAQMQAQAAGSGDQGIYDKARQALAAQGIDTSDWAPDIATGGQQAQTSLMAHSSLPGLINAQAKTSLATTAANTSQGESTPTPKFGFGVGLDGKPIITSTQGDANPSPARPVVTPAQGKAAVTKDDFNKLFTPQSPDVQDAADTKYGAPQTNVMPNAIPGTTPGASNLPPVPTYTPPAYDSSKTPDVNKQIQDKAVEVYKSALEAYKLQNSGAIKTVESEAGKTGELTAVDKEKAALGMQLVGRLTKNLQAMKMINPDVPSAGFLPGGVQSYTSQALAAHPLLNSIAGDNGNAANASYQWDQIDMQQVLAEIQQFLQTGGAGGRINQTLERMAKTASSINKEAPIPTRATMIDNALAEIENKNTSMQNIVGGNGEYKDIPVTASASAPSPQNSVISYKEFFK